MNTSSQIASHLLRSRLGKICVAITGATPEEMRQYYQSVEVVGRIGTTYSMPYEHRNIYLARGRKTNLLTDWPAMKAYI